MPSGTRNQVDAGTADQAGGGRDVDPFQGGRLARAMLSESNPSSRPGPGQDPLRRGYQRERVGTGRPADGWHIEVHGGMHHSRGIQETGAYPWGWLGAEDIGRHGKLAAGAQLWHPESAGHLT